jgi:hypothetical protein
VAAVDEKSRTGVPRKGESTGKYRRAEDKTHHGIGEARDMIQNQTYIVAFIFAGLAVAGVVVLAGLAYSLYLFFRYRAPKSTEWEKAWEDIEKEINK